MAATNDFAKSGTTDAPGFDLALSLVEQMLAHLKTAACELEASATAMASDAETDVDLVAEADRARCQASDMRSVAGQVEQEIFAARNGNKKITSGFVSALQSKITTALQQGEAGAAEVVAAHEESVVAHTIKAVKAFVEETKTCATRREAPTRTASTRRSSPASTPTAPRAPEPSAWERAQRAARQAADYAAERARELREAGGELLDRVRHSSVVQSVTRAGAAVAAFASHPMDALSQLGESAMETAQEIGTTVMVSAREMHVIVVEKVTKAKDTVVATVAETTKPAREFFGSVSDRLVAAAASAKHAAMALWQDDEKQQQLAAEKKALAKAREAKAQAQAKAAVAAAKPTASSWMPASLAGLGALSLPSLPHISLSEWHLPSLF